MKFFNRWIFLFISTLALCSSDALGAEDFAWYENKTAGLKIKHPVGWVQDEKVPGVLVAFGAPKEKANPDLVENVTIAVHTLTPEIATLEKYTEKYAEELRTNPNGPKVVESHQTTLAGLPAYRIVCVGKHNNFDVKFMQVWMLKNGKAYFCTYGAMEKTYSNFVSEAEGIIASLKFL